MRTTAKIGTALYLEEALSAEYPPRDFRRRVKQRDSARGVGTRVRRANPRVGAKVAALATAVAVPALATPSVWSAFGNEPDEAIIAPMPFEQPGSSFPGSAFYYLADEPYTPLPAAAEIHSDADTPRPVLGHEPKTAARPLVALGTALDRGRALQCLTQAIYYEAASESDAGQRAVAQVVLNRVAHPAYPGTVCGVVYQGSERRTGCQFTFTCDGSLSRKPMRAFWDRAQGVALAALSGAVYQPIGLATHYHTTQVNPYWAASLDRVGTIGAHIFYRWRGAAGKLPAFRFAYFGGEPMAVPRTGSFDDNLPLDPVAMARAYEAIRPTETMQRASGSARTAASPAAIHSASNSATGDSTLFVDGRLPASGMIKPEYAQSGQWISRP